MDVTLFSILDRQREWSASFAIPTHFSLDQGQPVSPQLLLDEPGWTPYCLDDENRRVLFVNTPPEVDLSQAAFVYSAQFEHAHRALLISYEALVNLSEAAQAPERLILIYSMGRCGSTLMSQILNEVEGVYSLSEPDVFTNLSQIRKLDMSRDAEFAQVIKACTRLLSPQGSGKRPTTLALKFRSGAIELCDMMQNCFPDARNLFMYRNALTWVQSVSRFGQRLGLPNELPRDAAIGFWTAVNSADTAYLEPYVDEGAETVFMTDLLALGWTSYLDRYMAHFERGVPFHTVRYEDLKERPEATLKAVFDYCALPDSSIEQALRAFETDSQAGTEISRDIHADDMLPERIEGFLAMLSRHPRFNRPEVILPDSANHASM